MKTGWALIAMARRCKFDIIIAILDTVSSRANKTKIVYTTNLNFSLATKYLYLLQENGLIELTDEGYKMTKEGEEYLEKARELQIWLHTM